MKHKIQDISFLSPNGIYKLTVERNGVDFLPGACGVILGKPYSISSTPNDPYLEFYIRRIDGGRASDSIHKYSPGDSIEIEEVFQYFFPGAGCEDSKFFFIATGTGASPLLSAMRYYTHKPQKFLHGVSHHHDLYIPVDAAKNTLIVPCISKESRSPFKRVTDALSLIDIDESAKYFICGRDQMINDVSNYLLNRGVIYSQISTEQFFYTK